MNELARPWRAAREADPAAAFDATVTIAGCRVLLHRSGAALCPQERVLIVADLHLEKGSAYARRGWFLPPYDSHDTMARLSRLVTACQPRRVVCLGDSFHDDGGPARLPAAVRMGLEALTSGRDWIWVAGNHDPAPPAGLPGRAVREIALGALTLRHEPMTGRVAEIAGHLHPAARVRMRGRSVRRRAFVSDGRRLVLPAFGAYAGGLNVCDPAFAGLFHKTAFHAWMIGRDALHPVEGRSLVPD